MWLFSHTSCPICREKVDVSSAVSCPSAKDVRIPVQDAAEVDLPEVPPLTNKDQESSSSRLNQSLRRILGRVNSQGSAAADFSPDIERT